MQKEIKILKKKIDPLFKFREILVINDYDIDSCSSASILWRILRKNNVKVKHMTISKGIENIIYEKIKKENPEKIVILDYVPEKEFVNKVKDYPTTLLDHHIHEKKLEVLDYFTMADYSKKYIALSYWLYLAAKDYGIKNIEWLAKLGCFWDKCIENTEFYEEGIYEKEMEEMLPFNIMVCFTQTRGASKMVEIFNTSSNFKDALEKVKSNKDYIVARKIFDEDLKNIFYSRKAYPEIKLNTYFVKTKFKHMRVFVDLITYRNPGTHVFILNEITRYKFSFRTTLNINLVEIIRKLSKEIPEFTGGGHKQACGAMLFSEDVDELLNAFIKEYLHSFHKLYRKNN